MRFLVLLILFSFPRAIISQELPPVINFNQNQYEAGNQNWMISQADNGNIYVANSLGLLEYSGAEWNLYPVPNNTIVRAVEVVKNLIYTGAYMEIGFWKPDETGILQYTSLVPAFKNQLKEGEQFWNIKSIGDILIFQSMEGLYLFNTRSQEISTIKSSASSLIKNLFKVDNSIYFQVYGEGLFRVQNNLPQLVISHDLLINKEIMHLSQKGTGLDIITRRGEFMKWDGEKLEHKFRQLGEKIRNRSVYSALSLPNDFLLVGTVEDGIYYVDSEGELIYHFNQQNGIINNTVLSLIRDSTGNIWAGLDNGLSVINLDSPIKLYQDNYGNLGSVYASYQTPSYLYLGTNQGLFFQRAGEENYNFIEGTNGQVWSLQELDGILFCGHNSGTFVIEGESAKRIYDRSGTWVVKKYEKTPGVYIQGHYSGLSLLAKKENEIGLLTEIQDFPHSSKFVLSHPNGEVWIGNEHKGVFKLLLDIKGNLTSLRNYTFPGVSGITSSIFKFNDTLYYSTTEKLFQYHKESDSFKEGGALSDILKKSELISGKIVNSTGNRIWGFTQNSVFNIEPAQLGFGYQYQTVYLPNDIKNITRGYENITEINQDSYLLGVSNGYLKLRHISQTEIYGTLEINKVFTSALDEIPKLISLSGTPPLHYKTNNVSFTYSVPEYRKFLAPVYSSRLLGMSSIWSEWSPATTAGYKNLTYGEYEFQVKARRGDVESNISSYKFTVARPWYISTTLIIIYVIIFIILLTLVHKAYKRKHLRMVKANEKELRMKHLEAEKTIIELQNEQLERDMVNKNKELAISTMNLIKKNEFLTSIKDKLKDSRDNQDVRSVIRTIDKDISEEDNWNFFKEAFNNADKDFFKKIKALHPGLTSNDLKLCAYLRLNLSSKEIAPLLNISVKSVEIKRYRLRKKMDLPREVNLSEHILEI